MSNIITQTENSDRSAKLNGSDAPHLIFLVVAACYGVACFYLYFRQSIMQPYADTVLFESDLPYHLQMILEDGWFYSFTAYIYLALYNLAGHSTIGIAGFLAIVTFLSVVLTEKILRELFSAPSNLVTNAGAVVLNFVMPFYLPAAGVYRYASYQSGNLWHNSTYLCMKTAALLFLLVFLRADKQYASKLSFPRFLACALLMALATFVKPSFLTVFAPAFVISLLIDLITRKADFGKCFLFGITMLPACLVVLWQNAVLFGDETGNSFVISPWVTFSLRATRPKLAVLCSLAFPLLILIFRFRDLVGDRTFRFAWIQAAIGFLEALLLTETGKRATDGNFLWGYAIALFWLYLVCFIKWIELYRERRILARIAFLISGVVFGYQIYCGIFFFIRLMQGVSYLMMS